MNEAALARLLRGKFSFLRPDAEELRATVPDWDETLPMPQRIFLRQEEATPIQGFPVLMNEPLLALRDSLASYVEAEEEFEVGEVRGRGGSRTRPNAAWGRYEKLLDQATYNAASASFGRRYPSIFWLYHSVAVARLFKESPRRVRRLDLAVGKTHGDLIKYLVYNRYLDNVFSTTYDVARRVAKTSDEHEREHFPSILHRLRDNVLVLTEDHVSPDLHELTSFFNGSLRIDVREFRERLANLTAWQEQELENDEFRAAVGKLLNLADAEGARFHLAHRGYVRYLSTRPGYDERRFLPADWIRVWETLVPKLKEFELLGAMRRLVVPIQDDGGRFKCAAAAAGLSLTGPSEVELSVSTRPMDFMTSWVVDPLVQRFGLIYDITEFSAIVSALRRSGNQAQDDSIRRIFRFQRRINQMAVEHRLQLEKYLGDGALYSGRFPTRLVAAAVHLQRYYRRALEEGFPFDRGMRIALNYGKYRLLPIEGAGGGQRYEFFGHGIVELTRLVTGKTTHEIDDVKTVLLSRGYAPEAVDDFFAPVAHETVDTVDKAEEARPFYAYVNASGVLINEGIVATQLFVEHLSSAEPEGGLYRVIDGPRRYVGFTFDEGSGEITTGVRKLGLAQLKGLGAIAIFEIVDCDALDDPEREPLSGSSLVDLVQREFEENRRKGIGRRFAN